jgi:hypothetical protein
MLVMGKFFYGGDDDCDETTDEITRPTGYG